MSKAKTTPRARVQKSPVRTVEKPTPEPPVETSQVSYSAERLYSLEENLKHTGPSSLAEMEAFLDGTTTDELVSEGARVDTSRLDTDGARICGIAVDFYERASIEQRTSMRGVSKALLRALAWSLLQGHNAYLDLHAEKIAARTNRYANGESATSLLSRGRAIRVQLAEALDLVAAGDKALSARIQEASLVMNSPDGVPGAIESLVDIGKGLLENPSENMKIRLADGEAGITEYWLNDCLELAADLRIKKIAAQAPMPSHVVSQADVDRWDGINLILLRKVIRLFEAANGLDPRVPRLIPIALRSIFARGKAKQSEPPPAPTP